MLADIEVGCWTKFEIPDIWAWDIGYVDIDWDIQYLSISVDLGSGISHLNFPWGNPMDGLNHQLQPPKATASNKTNCRIPDTIRHPRLLVFPMLRDLQVVNQRLLVVFKPAPLLPINVCTSIPARSGCRLKRKWSVYGMNPSKNAQKIFPSIQATQ